MLGGEVMTRLNSSGDKVYTYVPAEGLLFARQAKNTSGQPVMEWTHRDPLGVTEKGSGGDGGYDPLGNYAGRPTPPPTGQTYQLPIGNYGQSYEGAGRGFTNANNYSTGCTWDGRPASCNSVMRASNNGLVNLDRNNFLPWTATGDYQLPAGLAIHWSGGVETGHLEGSFITGDPLGDTGGFMTHVGYSSEPNNSMGKDPCEGKKGGLNYFAWKQNADGSPRYHDGSFRANEHIYNVHVDPNHYREVSKYIFAQKDENATPGEKMKFVALMNKATFLNAKGVVNPRSKNIEYVYAFDQPDQLDGTPHAIVGTDTENAKGWRTNVNTLVVEPDCQTVVTSHPGAPSNWDPYDQRITGHPEYWPPAHPGRTRPW
jgi:hypothetical protein